MGKKTTMQGVDKICSAQECQSRGDRNTSLHLFPINIYLQNEWKKICNIDKTQKITKNYYICSKHFLPSDYVQGNINSTV